MGVLIKPCGNDVTLLLAAMVPFCVHMRHAGGCQPSSKA